MPTKRIHFICRHGLNLALVEFPVCESGYWDIPIEDAQQMIGGMIYLHEEKAAVSYWGGVIEDWRTEERHDVARPMRIAFRGRSISDGKDARWEGDSHQRAHYSGIVES